MDIVDSVSGYVDFAVNEQCAQYDECDVYDSMMSAGKPIYHIEYGSGSSSRFCVSGLNTVIKKQSLDGWVAYCDGSQYNTPTS